MAEDNTISSITFRIGNYSMYVCDLFALFS